MRGKSSKLAVLLLALAMLAAGCAGDDPAVVDTGAPTDAATDAPTDEPATPADTPDETDPPDDDVAGGGTFSVYICEPESLIPGNTNETCGAEVLNALFRGLIDYDPATTDPVNLIATDISSDDQQNWTITLDEGWTFHDGTPVTAQSFVQAWNWTADARNAAGNSYFFENIEGYDDLQPATEGADPAASEMSGLSAPDDTTIEVTLKAPFSQFPLTLGYTAFYPLPDSFFDDPEAFNEAPVGNGPFMMEGSWNHDQDVNVVRFDDYSGESAAADGVEFRIYSEIDTAYNDLLAGNLDIMDGLPPAQIESAMTEFGDRFIEGNSSSHTYLGIPTYQPAFENIDLRHAISMAIDRQAIVDAILPQQTPAFSVVSPVVAGSRENPCGEFCEYNPEAALELYDAAGGYEGTLTLWFNSGAGHEQWVEAVANQLRQNLGIESIEFETLEFAEYLGLLDEEQVTGPYRLGWVMDYPSPQNYLEPLFATGGSSNNSGYSNPEVDELIAQGNQAPTVEEGIDFYNQAEDLILADMPHIPMFFGRLAAGHSDCVDNVVIDAFTRISTDRVSVTGDC